MKRYRLKKELPMFNVGDVFRLEDGGLWKDAGEMVPIMAYCQSTIDKYPNILKDWFEEIPEEPKTVWDLKDGDEFWCLGEDGSIYNNDIITLYKEERDLGNIFLTKEEAEKERDRRKAKQILLRDTKGFKPDWKSAYPKFEVVYDHNTGEFHVESWKFHSTHRTLWFESREDAKASIEAHKEEWKIYLGVEDD